MADREARDIEVAVLAHADELGIAYEAIRIDAAFAGTAAFCERYGYTPESSANCILVASKTGQRRHVTGMVESTRRLDVNGTVRRPMGVRKVSFAPAEETVALTGMLPDGVTPLGLPGDVPVLIDAGVLAHEGVIIGGGSRA